MAKRILPKRKEKPQFHCKDCARSYDWHEKDWKGELFLCKCPFYKNGKFYKFLSDPQCDQFVRREVKENGKG